MTPSASVSTSPASPANAANAFSWGTNANGQLGDGTLTQHLLPLALDVSVSSALNGKTVVQMAVGFSHSLALDSAGQVYACGFNANGHLGDGSTTQRLFPVAVNISVSSALYGKTVIRIAAGSTFSLAVDSSGQVYTWGGNTNGQLGDGTTTQRLLPVVVSISASSALNGKTIVQISAGNSHALALDSSGKVYAWGNNANGQLGDGTATQRLLPVVVSISSSSALNGKTIVLISAGNVHSLALDSAGQVYAWGNNANGKLGDGTMNQRVFPVAVNVSTSSALNGKTVVQISAGNAHSLAVDSAGQVYAWGGNTNGRLGDGTTTNQLLPVAVNVSTSSALNGKTITQVSASTHSFAVDSAGQVYAWGSNSNGQLGDGTTTNQLLPVAVNVSTSSALNGKTITQVAAGNLFSVAVAETD
jgi:alpha-tubulin suppressor-like RCC1 family protein